MRALLTLAFIAASLRRVAARARSHGRQPERQPGLAFGRGVRLDGGATTTPGAAPIPAGVMSNARTIVTATGNSRSDPATVKYDEAASAAARAVAEGEKRRRDGEAGVKRWFSSTPCPCIT